MTLTCKLNITIERQKENGTKSKVKITVVSVEKFTFVVDSVTNYILIIIRVK